MDVRLVLEMSHLLWNTVIPAHLSLWPPEQVLCAGEAFWPLVPLSVQHCCRRWKPPADVLEAASRQGCILICNWLVSRYTNCLSSTSYTNAIWACSERGFVEIAEILTPLYLQISHESEVPLLHIDRWVTTACQSGSTMV